MCPYPGSFSKSTVVDDIHTDLATVDGIVDTINTNVSNLAPAYGKVSCAPDLAAGKTVTAVTDGSTWTLGAHSSALMTASSNTIVAVHIQSLSAAGSYQLNLYAASVICGSIPFARAEVAVINSLDIPYRTQKVTGAITAKLASSTNDGETCVVKLSYV